MITQQKTTGKSYVFHAGERLDGEAFSQLLEFADIHVIGNPRVMPEEYRFDVFGRRMAIARSDGAWVAYLIGVEGKRRHAGFEIPDFVTADELAQYLDDLFHEDASLERPGVVLLGAAQR